MIYTGTNSSLQKRAEEAIRYAIDYQLGYQGNVYATDEATNTITVALISNNTLAAGDPVIIGDQSRTIVSISVIANTNSQRYRIILSAAVDVTAGDIVRADLSNNVRRSDDMRSDEGVSPLVIVEVLNLKEAWAGAPDFSGSLVVGVDHITNTITAEDGSQITDTSNAEQSEAHQLLVQRISDILLDAQTIADLTMFSASRPVNDFTLKGLYDSEEPGGGFDGARHVFEIRKRIVVSRTDDF